MRGPARACQPLSIPKIVRPVRYIHAPLAGLRDHACFLPSVLAPGFLASGRRESRCSPTGLAAFPSAQHLPVLAPSHRRAKAGHKPSGLAASHFFGATSLRTSWKCGRAPSSEPVSRPCSLARVCAQRRTLHKPSAADAAEGTGGAPIANGNGRRAARGLRRRARSSCSFHISAHLNGAAESQERQLLTARAAAALLARGACCGRRNEGREDREWRLGWGDLVCPLCVRSGLDRV